LRTGKEGEIKAAQGKRQVRLGNPLANSEKKRPRVENKREGKGENLPRKGGEYPGNWNPRKKNIRLALL